jgi:hypothetical protein
VLPVGGPPYLALVGSGSAQNTFEIKAGYHVRHSAVAVIASNRRVERFEPGRQYYRAYVDFYILLGLVEIYGVVIAYRFALAAFLFLEVQAALVYIGDEGYCLREEDVDRFVLRDILVERIGVCYRAAFDAGSAAAAPVLDNIPGFLYQRYLEVSGFAINLFDFCVCEYLYIRVPADLDQFR